MKHRRRWAYRLLLCLQPRALRCEFGDDMADDFERMIAAARARGARWPVLRVWLRALADVIVTRLPARRLRNPPHHRSGHLPARPHRSFPMATFLHDLRFAVRGWRRQPLFVLVASLTIAVGVSATATIFSAVNGLLLQPPTGVHDHRRLVTVHRIDDRGTGFHAFGVPEYRDLAAAPLLEELVAYDTFEGGLAVEEIVARTAGAMVSGNYFRALGTQAAAGRLLGPLEDSAPGGDAVVVISERLWRQRFGARADALGRRIELNGRDFTVIGVAEPGFSGHVTMFPTDVWVPLAARRIVLGAADPSEEASGGSVELFGRLGPGQSAVQARAALDAAGAALAEARGAGWHGVDVLGYSPVVPAAREPLTAFLVALFVVAGVLLTITAVNVANMLLSRGASRVHEIGVRLAMGATRSRLVTQLLTESMVLFVLGGALGILFTYGATGLLAAISLPLPVTLDLDLSPDVTVLAFALAVAGGTGLVFGLSPALHATRVDLVSSLKDGAARAGKGRRLREALVFSQVAASAVLLVCAGLLVRSLGAAGATDLGLEPQGVSVFFIDPAAAGRSPQQAQRFFGEALAQARSTPGVEHAGLIDVPPLTLSNAQTFVVLPDRPPAPDQGWQRVEVANISPGYFDTVRIPLLAGRDFSARDERGAPVVIVINETLAELAWPGESPIGKRLGFGGIEEPLDAEVIGLARDSKIRSAGDPPRFMVYSSWRQFQNQPTLLVRAATADAVASVRDRLRALDPALPPAFIVPYAELAGVSLLPGRVAATLAAAFGLIGTLLAAIGLYGLLAFAVAQRAREIGVRLALGAEPAGVRRLIVSHGLRVTAAGLLCGLLAAAGVAQLISGLLFGISPFDPVTYVGIAAILLAVATLACWLPARRAAATDPVVALRAE
jgi:predicted permease